MSNDMSVSDVCEIARQMQRLCDKSGMSADAILSMVRQFDERAERTRICGLCDNGIQDVTLAGDSFKRYRPCPHCRSSLTKETP